MLRYLKENAKLPLNTSPRVGYTLSTINSRYHNSAACERRVSLCAERVQQLEGVIPPDGLMEESDRERLGADPEVI